MEREREKVMKYLVKEEAVHLNLDDLQLSNGKVHHTTLHQSERETERSEVIS